MVPVRNGVDVEAGRVRRLRGNDSLPCVPEVALLLQSLLPFSRIEEVLGTDEEGIERISSKPAFTSPHAIDIIKI